MWSITCVLRYIPNRFLKVTKRFAQSSDLYQSHCATLCPKLKKKRKKNNIDLSREALQVPTCDPSITANIVT